MSSKLQLAITSSLILASAVPAHSQPMSEADMAEVQLALNRGQLLYTYDQAAWHGTDAMVEDVQAQGRMDELTSKAGGWVIREADQQSLEFVIFDKSPDAPKLLYAARLTEGGTKVVSRGFLSGDKAAPDGATLKLISAHRAALAAISGKSLLRCANRAYNIAVLPPKKDGDIPVFLLTPQTDNAQVPFGGHTRIVVAADGAVGDPHPFTKTCLNFPTAKSKKLPEALVASQLLDPLPTEIDVFTMFASGLPFYVYTPDGRTWAVESSGGQARVRLIPDKPRKD